MCDSCGVWAFRRRRGTRLPEIQNFQIAFSLNALSTVQFIFVTPVQLTLGWIRSDEYQRILSVQLVACFPYYNISCLPNTSHILEERKALSGDLDVFFILSNYISVLTWITKFYLGSIMCGKWSQSMLVHDAYGSPLTQSKWQGKDNWRGISRVMLAGKEPVCQCNRHKRCRFNPWVGKIPWRKAWQSTPVLLPEETHGQRSLGRGVAYSPRGGKE